MVGMPQNADHLTDEQRRRQTWRLMSLGAVIRVLRRERGWTQAQLAERVALSTRGVVRAETGGSSISVALLGRFADAFGMKPSELLRQSEVWTEDNLES